MTVLRTKQTKQRSAKSPKADVLVKAIIPGIVGHTAMIRLIRHRRRNCLLCTFLHHLKQEKELSWPRKPDQLTQQDTVSDGADLVLPG